MDALLQVGSWPVENVSVAVVAPDGIRAWQGDDGREYRWASITKLVTALAVLVAAEEGVVDLDEPAGPDGSTVRHLLAHASGLPFEGTTPIARPGERRIYSNSGYEALADHLAARAEMPFEQYLSEAILTPLDFSGELRGSPASGLYGTLLDVTDVAREFLHPTLVAAETLAEATSVQFPGLAGVLPEFGRMTPNDWGLGPELRDEKSPHWTGTRNSPRTFGHFGGSGTFLWVDPDVELALAVLTDRAFDEWKDDAKRLWPELSDAVLADVVSSRSR